MVCIKVHSAVGNLYGLFLIKHREDLENYAFLLYYALWNWQGCWVLVGLSWSRNFSLNRKTPFHQLWILNNCRSRNCSWRCVFDLKNPIFVKSVVVDTWSWVTWDELKPPLLCAPQELLHAFNHTPLKWNPRSLSLWYIQCGSTTKAPLRNNVMAWWDFEDWNWGSVSSSYKTIKFIIIPCISSYMHMLT